jgi:hypothetical protein
MKTVLFELVAVERVTEEALLHGMPKQQSGLPCCSHATGELWAEAAELRTEGRTVRGSPGKRLIDREGAGMALARVVSFEGVSKDRMEEMRGEMRESERAEGLPATEVVVLHDPEAETSLVVLFFESEDDYRRGDEMLNAMPAGDTPGQRSSVTKYDVAMRMTP